MAALLALDGTQVTIGVLGAIPLTITATAALVAAWNARSTKKLTKKNGGVHEHEDGTVTGSVLDLLIESRAERAEMRDDIADVKRAVSDIASTTAVVMAELAKEKARAQYAEAELNARLEIQENH